MTLLATLLGALVTARSAGAIETPTRIILPPEPIITEPSPDGRFDPAKVMTLVREHLATTGGFAPLNLKEEKLSENDKAVLLIPVLTSVRVSRTEKAGTTAEVVAYVGGGFWMLDPWTNAVLFSATRLTEAPVRVAVESRDREDQVLRQAFLEATSAWVSTCTEQIRKDASPFLVEGPTGAIPGSAATTNGLWLRGRKHGVTSGMVIGSSDRESARVEAVADGFSVIRDVIEAGKRIPAGRRYRVISVNRPTERPEPLVSLGWIGSEPTPVEDTGGKPVTTSAGVLDIVQMYAAKEGGLRILPSSTGGLASSKEFRELSEDVSRYAKLATQSIGTTAHRQTTLQNAIGNPDLHAEVGVLGSCHGSRKTPDGRVEHLFRVTLLGAISVPDSEGAWSLARTFEVTEEVAAVELEDVRRIRKSDVWFTAWRNASVKLGRKLQETSLSILATMGKSTTEGRVNAAGVVVWPIPAPATATPLKWLRPAGEVTGADGVERLGRLLEPIPPTQGFLTRRNLGSEKLLPGDVLSYRAGGFDPPLLNFLLSGEGAMGGTGPESILLSRLAQGALAETGLLRTRNRAVGALPLPSPLLQLIVGTQVIEEAPAVTRVSGEWRLRLWPAGIPDQGDPWLKAGISYTAERAYEAKRPLLVPRDVNENATLWAEAALKDVVAKAKENGLAAAVALEATSSK